MRTGGILDADMATVGGWIARGGRWWIDELAAMIPARWRTRAAGASPPLRYDPVAARLVPVDAGAAMPRAPVAIMLPPAYALRRVIERPATGARALPGLLALDHDRIMPLPRERILIGGRIVSTDAARRRMVVVVAGLPLDRAEAVATATRAAGIEPTSVLAPGPEGDVDLLPAFAGARLLAPPRRDAARWWAIAAFLFAANVGILVARDVARTEALQALVDAQQPAVDASHRLARRMEAANRTMREVTARRAVDTPLAILARVSAAAPPGSSVERLTWQPGSIRIGGTEVAGHDFASALRRAGGFRDVRSDESAPVTADVGGRPFELLATIAGQ